MHRMWGALGRGVAYMLVCATGAAICKRESAQDATAAPSTTEAACLHTGEHVMVMSWRALDIMRVWGAHQLLVHMRCACYCSAGLLPHLVHLFPPHHAGIQPGYCTALPCVGKSTLVHWGATHLYKVAITAAQAVHGDGVLVTCEGFNHSSSRCAVGGLPLAVCYCAGA